MASRIPFPNRFYAAVGFAANPPLGAHAVSDETRLLLYALYQQATSGPCAAPKPWGWNAIESAKWSSWTQLGSTPRVDAMRMYVTTMEEENEDWFDLFTDNEDPLRVQEVMEQAAEAVAAAGEETAQLAVAREREQQRAAVRFAGGDTGVKGVTHPGIDAIDAPHGRWRTITGEIKGKPPRGRYSHVLAAVGDDVFVVGGNAGGRRLGDVCALNVSSLSWRQVNCVVVNDESADDDDGVKAFPPRSGHAAVAWGRKIVVVGGYHADDANKTKTEKGHTAAAREATETLSPTSPRCEVWVFNTETSEWRHLALGGVAPFARGGHSATLVRSEAGARIVVFGGEDCRGRLLDDVSVIDLVTQTWVTPTISGMVPTARTGHVAACFGGGAQKGAAADVYVFGGVSNGEVSGELFALDTKAMTWRELSPSGVAPVPRAGAAGAVIGDTWFVCAGGGADSGVRDTVALRLGTNNGGGGDGGDPEWAFVAEVDSGNSLAAEGAGVVSVGGGAALVAFGGYDGTRYSADTHVLKRPAAGTLAMTKTKMLSPVKHKAWVSAAEAEHRRNGGGGGRSPMDRRVSMNDAAHANHDNASSESESELTRVRRELAETRLLLSKERTKSSRLEAIAAESRARLEYANRNPRADETVSERSSPVTTPTKHTPENGMSPSPPKRKGGVWAFITGYSPDQDNKTAAPA